MTQRFGLKLVYQTANFLIAQQMELSVHKLTAQTQTIMVIAPKGLLTLMKMLLTPKTVERVHLIIS